MRRVLILTILPWVCHAAGAPASLAVEPSAMSFGCVNVITGDYCEARTDHTVTCFEPIPIQRIHVSSDQDDDVGGIWRSCGEQVCVVKTDAGIGIYVVEAGGGVVKFAWGLEPLLPDLGNTYCNTGAGPISGQTNLSNYRLSLQGLKVTLTTGSGEKRIYRHLPDDPQMVRDLSQYHYGPGARWAISEVIRPNGNRICYEYGEPRVEESGIVRHKMKQTALSQNKDRVFGWAEYDYRVVDHGHSLTVRTSENRSIERYVAVQGTTRGGHRSGSLLQDVTYCDRARERYSYDTRWDDVRRPFLLSESLRPDGRRRQIEYYRKKDQWVGNQRHWTEKSDMTSGWVYCLKSSAASEGEIVPVAWYEYGYQTIERRRQRRLGWTDVLDACGGLVRYHYDDCDRLTKVIRRGTPDVSVEQFVWDGPLLIARSISDGEGHGLVAISYFYDDRGNVLEETLWGNLSGTCTQSLAVDERGAPTDNGIERHTIFRSYSSDGFNLLLSEIDGPTESYFSYRQGTNLVTSKRVFECGQPRQRVFYFYNPDASVACSIQDNGIGVEVQDLSGVTERRRVKYTYRADKPGLPVETHEYCWDPYSNSEQLLRREVNHYNQQNLLHSRSECMPDNHCDRTTTFDYDDAGRLVAMVDPIGQTTHNAYDDNGNLVEFQSPSKTYKTVNTYDLADRLIESCRIGVDGSMHKREYSYDLLGRKTREIDLCGRATDYEVDAYGRCITERLPAVKTEAGWIRPEILREYNALDQVTCETDSNGNRTEKKYNARGDLVEICFPDGTLERCEYALDGRLTAKIERNETRVEMTRDYLDRVTAIQRYDRNGALLTEEFTVYEGSRKILEVDPEGHETRHDYNAFGQLIETTKGNVRTTWYYDGFGRKCKECRWLSPTEYCATLWEYDLLDRITSERQETSDSTLVSRTDFEYDSQGNKVAIHAFILADQIASTRFQYDILGRKVSETNPVGATTVISYDHHYKVDGEPVLARIATDPLGRETMTLLDASERPVRQVVSCLSQVLSEVDYAYDPAGNKTGESHAVISGGKFNRTFQLRWSYGPSNRLASVTEKGGEAGESTTLFSYNGFGQLSTTERPDKSIVSRLYDSLGRLAAYAGPGFDYSYTYDRANNILRVDSPDGAILRSYDVNNRLIEETSPTGLVVRCKYDTLGRQTQLSLPDGSTVDYVYDAANLRFVNRAGETHAYRSYNLRAQPLVETTIAGHNRVRSYDLLGRVSLNQYESFTEAGFNFDLKGNLLGYTNGTSVLIYSYDLLDQLCVEPGHTYEFDSISNRIAKDSLTYEVNGLNHVCHDGASCYHYDSNGNLTQSRNQTYVYDGLDRLIEVESGDHRYVYSYDAFNRRITKRIDHRVGSDWNSVSLLSYLYDGQREIGLIDAQGRLVEFRALSTNVESEIGASVLVELDGCSYCPQMDFRGSVVALTELDKGAVETYVYTAYGERNENCCIHNPWGFLGKREDSETGFINFGRRYYFPALGRWISADPAGYTDGPNLYAYCSNQPLTSVDLWGLEKNCSSWEHFKGRVAQIGRGIRDLGSKVLGIEDAKRYYGQLEVGTQYDLWERPGFSALYTNGVNTSLEKCRFTARYFAENYFRSRVNYIYNPTLGLRRDVMRAAASRVGLEHPAVAYHVEYILDTVQRLGPSGRLVWIAHSEATIIAHQVLKHLPDDVKTQIDLYAIGGPKRIARGAANTAQNYVAPGDPVTIFAGGLHVASDVHDVLFHAGNPNPVPAFSEHDIIGGPYEENVAQIARSYELGGWQEAA